LSDRKVPGLTSDPQDLRCGSLVCEDGKVRRVYIKRSRTPERHENERFVLEMISQVGAPPVPQLLASYTDETGAVLALGFIDGVNLADLLIPGPLAPPRPAWYEPARLERHPAISELLPLLADLGRAVGALHAIPLTQFGKLTGEEPNPHRLDARLHTRQEAAFRVELALDKGHIQRPLAQAWLDWLDRHVDCIDPYEPPCLVHYDLHAGNVRVARNPQTGAWEFRALYDFELGRAWLPELDLAAMYSDLEHLEGDGGEAWSSFLSGYGPVDPDRLRLFEFIRLLSAVAYGERYPPWAVWSRRWLEEFIEPEEIYD
jgi:hypothetical protein